MLETEQLLIQNLEQIEQAHRQNSSYRIALVNRRPVVEITAAVPFTNQTSPPPYRDNSEGVRKLREQLIQVITDPNCSMDTRKRIVQGTENNLYRFLCQADVTIISEAKKNIFSPVSDGPDRRGSPLLRRGITLTDVMQLNPEATPIRLPPPSHAKAAGYEWCDDVLELDSKATPIGLPATGRGKAAIYEWYDDVLELDSRATPISLTVTERPESEYSLCVQDLDLSYPADHNICELSLSASSSTTLSTQSSLSLSSGNYSAYRSISPPDSPEYSSTASSGSSLYQTIRLESIETPDPVQSFYLNRKTDLLEEECRKLSGQLPNISPERAKTFLWIYNTCHLLQLNTERYDDLMGRLDEQFEQAGLSGSWQEIKAQAIWQSLRSLKIELDEGAFQQLIESTGEETTPQRFALIRSAMHHLLSMTLSDTPSPTGNHSDQIDSLQLEILQACNAHPEGVEQFGLESDWANKLRERLKDELAQYFTGHKPFIQLLKRLESLDADAMKDKLLEGIPLDDHELSVVVQAKKQRLELMQTLGRKWGSSVLLDPALWPEKAGIETVQKLYQLADMESPSIHEAELNWPLESHRKAKSHPAAVVEGGDTHALLSALTLLEAGAKVTLVMPDHPKTARTVRLDPLWTETLRFYLGQNFHTLFHQSHSAERTAGDGILHSDGTASVDSDALTGALLHNIERIARETDSPLARLSGNVTGFVKPTGSERGRLIVTDKNSSSQALETELFFYTAPSEQSLEWNPLQRPKEPVKNWTATATFQQTVSTKDGNHNDPVKNHSVLINSTFLKLFEENLKAHLGNNAPNLPDLTQFIQKSVQLTLIESREGIDETQQPAEELNSMLALMEGEWIVVNRCSNQTTTTVQTPLPEALNGFIEQTGNTLTMLKAKPHEQTVVIREIVAAWFETLAVTMGLPAEGIMPGHLRPESIGVVDSQSKVAVSELLYAESSPIIVVAAGSAIVNATLKPEDRYSAAREHLLRCCSTVKQMSMNPGANKPQATVELLNAQSEQTTQLLKERE